MAYIYYVDGSCSNNGNFPNEGGFSVVKVDPSTGEVVDHYAKRSVNTTNNREELKAILWVMLNHGHENPIVYSDSAYSVNTYTTWMFGWARRGWLKADKKPPENLDLIKVYYEFYEKGYRLQLKHCKGHAGNMYNELADRLAKGEK
jgi:ribonuclease HI